MKYQLFILISICLLNTVLSSNLRNLNTNNNFPVNFDAREEWPDCENIKKIEVPVGCDQSYVQSVASAMSDRICIQSHQTNQVVLSAYDILTCCHDCGLGCQGGYLEETFAYYEYEGVVSEKCKPYPQNFNPHLDVCSEQCVPHSGEIYNHDKHHGTNIRKLQSIEEIQSEIQTNGPVVAQMNVYDDFFEYKSGVYIHETGFLHGDTQVKIIGWGEENGEPYWLCASFWDTHFGEQGFFKILKGHNESDIESEVWTATPN